MLKKFPATNIDIEIFGLHYHIAKTGKEKTFRNCQVKAWPINHKSAFICLLFNVILLYSALSAF